MEQEQIKKMCLETSDKNYHTFLHNEGWKYDTEAAAIAGYERLRKSTLGRCCPRRSFRRNCLRWRTLRLLSGCTTL